VEVTLPPAPSSIGLVVVYLLHARDLGRIKAQRAANIPPHGQIFSGHSDLVVGESVAAVVTRVGTRDSSVVTTAEDGSKIYTRTPGPACANLHLLLDGNDSLYVSECLEGSEAGTWHRRG
jgi:hypothetical protein